MIFFVFFSYFRPWGVFQKFVPCTSPTELQPKDPKKSQKGVKISVWRHFRHFFDTPGGEAREDPFETFWGFRGSGVWGVSFVHFGSFFAFFVPFSVFNKQVSSGTISFCRRAVLTLFLKQFPQQERIYQHVLNYFQGFQVS